MEFSRRHGQALSAALVLVLLFALILGSAFIEIIQQKQDLKFLSQNLFKDNQWKILESGRRKLTGPGSSPPVCRSRCGDCFPCRPIHVAIQQGQIIPLEYYPEAWRCKCRDKLFIP